MVIRPIPNAIKGIKLNMYEKMKNVKYCKQPRFLIVEDNSVAKKNIKITLKKINPLFLIDFAITGKEAVQKFKGLFMYGYVFDMILMDMDLPEMKGIEATQLIRKNGKRIREHPYKYYCCYYKS